MEDDGTAAAAAPAFLPVSAGRAGVRLRALHPWRAPPGGGALIAFCRGVEVGRCAVPASLPAGAEVELPVARLPRTALPAELRFAAAAADADLAPPWPLPNAAAALALLGAPAALEVEELRLDQGVLRGVARERANGLLEPVMYARINGAGARGAATEPPWPLPEGGCAFRFALPLEPGDLEESGLTVALHLVGVEAPVARFAYARVGLDGPAPRVAELEARVARLEGRAAADARALDAELARRAAVLEERTDAFVEAAAALLLDRLAGTASAAGPDGDAPRVAALRRLIAEAAAPPEPPAAPLVADRRAEIPPTAGNLAIGWHPPEEDAGGPFRWMGDAALVVNPEPHRPVAAVTLAVRHLYGADAPGLSAAFDGAPAAVAATRTEDGGFAVRATPGAGAPPPLCQGLRLEAAHAGVPLRDGASADPRLLSVAVSGVVFEYAA